MKPFLFIVSTLFLLTAFSSCKKTNRIENSSIVGKWQIQSVFNGYANGGNFKWNDVPVDHSYILTFTNDGLYNQKDINGYIQECNGTYLLTASDTLEINTDCNSGTDKTLVSELTRNFLIIDRQGIEGKIRYRYIWLK